MRRTPAACLAAALLGLAGCGGEDTIEAHLRLVVPDNNIRVEGIECAGARPFEYVRPGAAFALEAADGSVLVDGELPAGHAENADPTIDWGVERIPTVCVLELELEDVPERRSYRLRLPEGRPLGFDRSHLSGDEPLQLVVE
ncbi:MAG TPA: hypothetical protein VNO56_08505 [Gaiellaceae bacterium]|nr:hypothetical protein [Gaiellaceae bacterium]